MNFKAEVVKFARLMEEKGFVNAAEGNISMLDRITGQLYITPSGKRKMFLEEDMIAVMKGDEQVGGSIKRSSEYLLHQAALKARPDCNAAIHCHCPYLTAYAVCHKPVKIDYYPEFVAFFREIPVLPFGIPGTPAIHQGIEEKLEDSDIVLLANHGVVCVGKDLEAASRFLEAAEAAARVDFIARQLGDPVPLPKEAYEVAYHKYHK